MKSDSRSDDARVGSTRRADKRKSRRVLNLPLLIGTLAVAAVLGPGAYFWHQRQVGRTAVAFLDQAARFEEEGNWHEAATYLLRYQRLRPDDAEAKIRLAETYDKSAKDRWQKSVAIDRYYVAVGVAGDAKRTALRLRLAELLLEIQRFSQAQKEAEEIDDHAKVKRPPKDAAETAAAGFRALALYGQFRLGAAPRDNSGSRISVVEAFDRALRAMLPANSEDTRIAVAPKRLVPVADTFARICRGEEQLCREEPEALFELYSRYFPKKGEPENESPEGQEFVALTTEQRHDLADAIIDRMVAANPDDPRTLLARYRYRAFYELSGADDDLALALAQAKRAVEQAEELKPYLKGANLVAAVAKAAEARPRFGEPLSEALGSYIEALVTAGDRAHRQAAAERGPREESDDARQKLLETAKRHFHDATDLARPMREAASAARTKGGRDGDGYSQGERRRDALAHLGLGASYADLGQPEEALQAWEEGVEICGDRIEQSELAAELHQRLASLRLSLLPATRQERDPEEVKPLLKALEANLAALEAITKRLSPVAGRSQVLGLERTRDLLRARYFLAQDDRARAISLLKRVTIGPSGSAAEAGQLATAWALLGSQYAALGLWDQAAAAFDQATSLQPNPQTRLAAANAWANVGRLDTALRAYRQALEADANAETCLSFAEAQLRSQAAEPRENRNWTEFQQALQRAKARWKEEGRDDGWRIALVEAEYQRVRAIERGVVERQQEAREVLAAAEAEYPESPELAQRAALFYERLGFSAEADRALQKHEKLAGQTVSLHLLRARLLTLRNQFDQARKVLHDVLHAKDKPLSAQDQTSLREGLVQIAAAEGERDAVRAELQRMHESDPSNVSVVRRLAELAMETNDLAALKKHAGQLEELEGPDGSFWRYYRAIALALESTPGDRDFRRAVELHAQVQRERPSWPNARYLGGLILERQGRYEEALQAYREAIRLGDRSFRVYHRLPSLLFRLGRFDEARELAEQTSNVAPLSPVLSAMGIDLAAREGDLQGAIEQARRAVEIRGSDPLAHINLGWVLLADGETDEAEAAFAKAVELRPDARSYNALVFFYLRTQRVGDAVDTLNKFAESGDLSPVQKTLVKAQGLTWLAASAATEAERDEYLTQARRAYEPLLDADGNPRDGLTASETRALAEFLSRYDPEKAENALKRLLEVSPGDGDARRRLATIRALEALQATGAEREQRWEQVLSLAEAGRPADVRLAATLLMRRGGAESLETAQQLVEKLIAGGTAVAEDHYLLARVLVARADLYQRDAESYQSLSAEARQAQDEEVQRLKSAHDQYENLVRQARQAYARLVAGSRPDRNHLGAFVDFLLRHGMLDEAEKPLARLEQRLPDNLGVVTARGRLLKARAEKEIAAGAEPAEAKAAEERLSKEIEKLVDAVAARLVEKSEKGGQAEAALAMRIGAVYRALEQHAAAERWYRRAVELVPENYQDLALSLGQQGRMHDAIQLCFEAAKGDASPKPATVLAFVLASGEPTADDFELAEPLLAKALADHGGNPDALRAVANVRLVQGKPDETIELYRKIVKLRPRDVLALNNLASLLAESGQPKNIQEALKHIDEAIRIAGPINDLLDTKATILICADQARDAIPLLETATSNPNADPRFHFHLAVARYFADRQDPAWQLALDTALERDLTSQILTDTDRRWLAELLEKHPKKSPDDTNDLTRVSP